MKLLRFHFIMFCALISCLGKSNVPDLQQLVSADTSRNITVILIQPPINSSIKRPNGSRIGNGRGNELSYYNTTYTQEFINIRYAPSNDTIIIPCPDPYIEVVHAYKGIDKLCFLFAQGDTVVITYEGLVPIVTTKNRLVLKYDLNYEIIKSKVIHQNNYPYLLQYKTPTLHIPPKFKNYDEEYKKVIANAKAGIEWELNKEMTLLDSLFRNDSFSKQYYDFYKLKNMFSRLQYRLLEGKVNVDSVQRILEMNHQQLSKYSFFWELLNGLVYKKYTSKIKILKTQNSVIPDYRILYDSLRRQTFINANLKNALLSKTLQDIIQNFPASDIESYYQKFLVDVENAPLVDSIKKKYKLGVPVSDDLQLVSLTGKEINFADILRQNSGKVVYVDFWASWCVPCIASMPFSRELSKKNKDQDIAFVYISLDDDFDKWKSSARRNKVDNPETSFQIHNKHTSRMLESLAITSVPRYLLYDMRGILIHKNAPPPESKQIQMLLNNTFTKKP